MSRRTHLTTKLVGTMLRASYLSRRRPRTEWDATGDAAYWAASDMVWNQASWTAARVISDVSTLPKDRRYAGIRCVWTRSVALGTNRENTVCAHRSRPGGKVDHNRPWVGRADHYHERREWTTGEANLDRTGRPLQSSSLSGP